MRMILIWLCPGWWGWCLLIWSHLKICYKQILRCVSLNVKLCDKIFCIYFRHKKAHRSGLKSGKRDASMKSLSLPRFYGDREKLRLGNESPFKKPKSDDTNISKIFYVNFEKILDCCYVKIFPLKCAFGEWFGCFPLPFRLGLPLI